jgi:hypothetical protein
MCVYFSNVRLLFFHHPLPMYFKRVGQVCGSKRANFERGAQGQGNAHQQAQAPPGRSVGRRIATTF